jgi:dTDP-4-dehydrorhamnose reductase
MFVKVLVVGKNGQLARELQKTVPTDIDFVVVGQDELDISSQDEVDEFINCHKPDIVINAAAYTAVDKAESEIEQAYAVNRDGPLFLAQACQSSKLRLIHVSTDFVFDGEKNKQYKEEDPTNPLGVYGNSKLEGEKAVIKHCQNHVIVRTAWVYSSHGNNFVKTMLKLMKDRDELGIVSDQIGTPTWARGLAKWIWSVVDNDDVKGVYHWTDAGVASWYDFSLAIQELGLEKGLLSKAIDVLPIKTEDYPTPAKRPAFSVLEKSKAEKASGMNTCHWRKQLSEMLDELTHLTQA